MFVYILFFITIACVLLVEGTSRETIQERHNTKTISEMKGVSTQLQTYLQRQTDYKVSDRRILNCTCGVTIKICFCILFFYVICVCVHSNNVFVSKEFFF